MVRFVSVNLHEPPKEVVLNFQEGDAIKREAFIVLHDPTTGAAYEAIVSLSEGEVTTWHYLPGIQPPILFEELAKTEELLKAHPDFQAVLQKRGIRDLDLVMVDVWSPGYYEDEKIQARRILRAFVYMRHEHSDNDYAHPIEGIAALVDINRSNAWSTS